MRIIFLSPNSRYWPPFNYTYTLHVSIYFRQRFPYHYYLRSMILAMTCTHLQLKRVSRLRASSACSFCPDTRTHAMTKWCTTLNIRYDSRRQIQFITIGDETATEVDGHRYAHTAHAILPRTIRRENACNTCTPGTFLRLKLVHK